MNEHYLQAEKKKKKKDPWVFSKKKKKGKGFKKKKEKRKMATYPLKKYRLRGREFREVLKKGKSFRVDGLVLKLTLTEEGKKFGFLINKKIFKKAVERNKIKRRLRELLREKLGDLKEGIRIVFITLSDWGNKDFKEAREIFEKILTKSKIVKK
jgi:ribonuclease P protein component